MKALVISPQPFFSPRGTPFSVYYRSLILSELGVEIDLLTYGEGQEVDVPGLRTIRIPRFGFLGKVKTGPSILKLFLDVFMVIWTIGLLIRRRYEYIHAHEEAVFWCRFLKPIFGFKLVYDMHSSLPQQLDNFDFTSSKMIHSAFRWLEDSAIHAADGIITICPDLRDYVDQLSNVQGKHVLIENSIFEPVRLTGTKHHPDQQDNGSSVTVPSGLLFVYAGTLESYQGIELIVDAMTSILANVPDATLLIVGGTANQVSNYRERAQKMGVGERCMFTGRVSKAQSDAYMDQADLLLSPRTEGTNTPLKIYQQIASGTPLVATNIYSHTQVLTESIAFLAEPDAESIGQSIIEALSDPAESARRAENARRVYESEYSRDSYVRKLKEILTSLEESG